ncbi:MAG: ABC transporter permease [Longimicrobiales bacterium]|nr:ABC transporter permease [Longimicrobiales bacterium]
MRTSPARWARLLIRLASALVPRARREEWMDEWRGELAALHAERRKGSRGLPTPLGFAVGALPHAIWMRMDGWAIDGLVQDIRYSTRLLRKAPGFTVVAASTLALGIGANGAIFSLVNGLVLRTPQEIAEPGRLVQIARSYETDPRWDNLSFPAFRMIREEARTLSGVAGYSPDPFVIGEGANTEQVAGQYVTGTYFDVLGVRPHEGRLIQPADDVEPGAHPVAVLSHALWTRRYGGDPGVIGEVISVGAQPYRVLGVAPPGFVGVERLGSRPEIFIPLMQHPGYRGETLFEHWGASWIYLFGRLADGVSPEEAEASMELVSARLREAAPVNEGIEILLASGVGLDPRDREAARDLSAILSLIVLVVLLLTCVNVANLFLARASGRREELGVRMAMGAGQGRLTRQLLTESLLVASLATLLAVPVILVVDDVLPALFPFPLSVSVRADLRVFAFLATVGLVAGILPGIAPAWVSARSDLCEALREGAATGTPARTRLRDGLVMVQLALSLGLVAGATLLGRSVMNAQSADPGFDADGVVAAVIDLSSTGRYDRVQGTRLFRAVLDRARETPGVRSATLANQMPLLGGHSRASASPVDREEVSFEAEYVVVAGDYFETLEIPVVRGRALLGAGQEPERVVVVNEALAAMFWPAQEPLGQRIAAQGETWRVVGVAGDVQMRSLRSRPNPAIYYPLGHAYSGSMILHLATEAGTGIGAAEARRIVASVDPQLPVATVVDLDSAAAASMRETRTIGFLVAAFALLALVLAVVGLYGLVSYSAAQRVREIGIRIALGAEPASLVRLILRRGLGIALAGIALGLLVASGLGSALGGLLFGVTERDPVAMGTAAMVLLAAAGLAAWIPARRASSVDAAVSLRD